MRSRWSAELVLAWLAAATLEGSWLTLVNLSLQWLKHEPQIDLGILAFCIAVGVGMIVARTFRNLPQSRYAAVLTVAAITAAAIGAVLSGAPTGDAGAFVRSAIIDPGVWLMGLAVLRGAVHGEPGSGYAAERVFTIGVPALVVFWFLATLNDLAVDPTYASAAFAATISFISAGLLAIGLGRLSDLDVDAIDRGARRRWLLLVVAIVGAVLLLGIPLAAVLGVPVAAAAVGVLGPLAPLLIALFSLMSIPIFAFFDLIGGMFPQGAHPFQSQPPAPQASGAGPPPLFDPPTGAPPDLTWILFVLIIVAILIVLRILMLFLDRPDVAERGPDEAESRAAEPFVLPRLPRVSLPRLPSRRPAPQTASEAYSRALVALAAGPQGRRLGETPREHAARITGSIVAPDVRRLAADYQLQALGGAPLTPAETRRALERWRRVARAANRGR